MTEQHILEAAYRLFHAYGIKSISMDDIAKDLGMSKKTLYKSFESKDALVHTIMVNKLDQNQCECNTFCDTADNAIHELILIMKNVKNMFHNMNPALFYDMQKYHNKSWKLFEEHENNFIFTKIHDNLVKGINEGLFLNTFTVEIIARMRLETIKLSFSPNFQFEKYSLEQVVTELFDHFIRGISTNEGQKIAEQYKINLDIK